MKYCNSCKTWKEETEFPKNAKSKDGLHSKCKTCHKAYNDAHKEQHKQYYQVHRKQKLKYQNNYREQNLNNAMNAENRNAAMYVDGDMNSCQICWRTRIPNLLIVSPCLFPRPFSTFREGRAVVPSCGGSPP